MELTEGQLKGLKIAKERYELKQPYTIIAGYAGTGKTTLVKFIIESLKIKEEDVAFISFTGKACEALRKKGNKNIFTTHKFLYSTVKLPNGQFIHTPKPELDHNYKIIIVDEISMLPKNIWELLLSHKVHVIGLGDPEQLPPVGEPNLLLNNPHIFLDEIMRQSKDNEIIELSMKIRKGESLQLFDGNQVQILPGEAINTGMLKWSDQILCGTNKTRKLINKTYRENFLDTENSTPILGDKIIGLCNNWHKINDSGDPLINGMISYISKINIDYFPKIWKNEEVFLNFIPEYYFNEEETKKDTKNEFRNILCDYSLLTCGIKSEPKYKIWKIPFDSILYEVDYGYAITTHKAQGSEWNKVLVIEEPFPFDLVDHKKWLYTACTRSIEKLVILKKD